MKSIQRNKVCGKADGLAELIACNGSALRKANRRVSQLYDSILAPAGLRSTQRSILVHIAAAGSPSIGELADSLVLDRSALAHNLKPLVRNLLVETAADTADRRTRLVRLTDRGRAKLDESLVLWKIAQQRFEQVFGNDQSRLLRDLLKSIASQQFHQAFEEAGRPQLKTGQNRQLKKAS